MYRITKREAIQKVLDELAGPAPVDEVVERVLQQIIARALEAQGRYGDLLGYLEDKYGIVA